MLCKECNKQCEGEFCCKDCEIYHNKRIFGKRIGMNYQIAAEINPETGELKAVYFNIRQGDWSINTKVLVENKLIVDYNRKDEVTGVEILGPVTPEELGLLPTEARKFVFSAIPRSWLL